MIRVIEIILESLIVLACLGLFLTAIFAWAIIFGGY